MICNACDPYLFIRVPISVPQNSVDHDVTMLVDSGFSHATLANCFTAKKAFLHHTTRSSREITGFDEATQKSNHLIHLRIDHKNQTFLFLITRLKDLYNDILGVPWIRHHGHVIHWPNHAWEQPIIPTAKAGLSYPKETTSERPG